MKGKVYCIDCKDSLMGEVEATALKELGIALSMQLLSVHTTNIHVSHRLRFELEDTSIFSDEIELKIKCLHEHCLSHNIEYITHTPIELVPVEVLAFHATHEGHMLDIWYGNKHIKSPRRPE
jgi:hypothetical protein